MVRSKKAAAGRGSPEAIQKRRVARRLNDLLTRGSGQGHVRDGRTEKRRRRLLSELDKATKTGGKALKPIELLLRINALLELGEPLSTIRKVARIRPNREIASTTAVQVLREVHAAYNFRPEAYRFLGLPHDALVEAKLIPTDAPRRGRPPKVPRG